MSSSSRYRSSNSAASNFVADASSASRFVAANAAASRFAAAGASSSRYAPAGNDAADERITINGVAEPAVFVYRGGDASIASWPGFVGSPAASAGTGTDPTVDVSTPFSGPAAKAVLINNGKVYQVASGSFGNVALEDIVLECILRATASAYLRVFTNADDSATRFDLQTGAAGNVSLTMKTGGTQVSVASPVLTPGSWYHLLWLIDRSGSGICYANSAAGTAASVSAIAASSLATAEKLTIGARSNAASSKYDDHIAWLAMWKRSAWLDTHLQPTLAASRDVLLTS